ncbi:hypothetical protein [Aristophania vespae]|uniref:hypothetical protein n=1 Tax=Aristophania vespae TaxID=2697033 RepID=UPI00235164C2|nr:hypothetical protein [Aristophania vespae]
MTGTFPNTALLFPCDSQFKPDASAHIICAQKETQGVGREAHHGKSSGYNFTDFVTHMGYFKKIWVAKGRKWGVSHSGQLMPGEGNFSHQALVIPSQNKCVFYCMTEMPFLLRKRK